MLKDIIRILYRKMEWDMFKGLNHISKEEGILALSGENTKVDRISTVRFPEYLKKKYLSKGVILADSTAQNRIDSMKKDLPPYIRVIYLPPVKLRHFYELHCVRQFAGNMVFTFIDTPKDNHLGKYLEKSKLDENDIVCLALFRLGHI